jgi:CubicO group peptidase (beta-lactamase class C family)
MAHVRRKIPITTTSLFNIASMAKQFTATCIALLEEQGKLSFDDDINRFFPQFQLKKPVTIRHLVSHTSGLREGYVLAALSGKVNLKGRVKKSYNTVEHLTHLMAQQHDLNFSPGEEFAYTNINYVLLGEIVRTASGLSLSEYADQHIFKPLGMQHTYFNGPGATHHPDRAIPYQYTDPAKGVFRPRSIQNDQGVIGDNNLITSVDDLILWSQNFDNNRLGAHKAALLKTLQTRYVLTSGDTTHYAFGLNVTPYRDVISVGHGGDDARYTSLMVRFPSHQLAIICLANRSVYEHTQQKVFALANLLLKQPPLSDSTHAHSRSCSL